jgi:phage tail sheath protein FI
VKGAWEFDSDRVVHVLARALGHHAKVKRYGRKFSWEVWRCSGNHGLTSIARDIAHRIGDRANHLNAKQIETLLALADLFPERQR